MDFAFFTSLLASFNSIRSLLAYSGFGSRPLPWLMSSIELFNLTICFSSSFLSPSSICILVISPRAFLSSSCILRYDFCVGSVGAVLIICNALLASFNSRSSDASRTESATELIVADFAESSSFLVLSNSLVIDRIIAVDLSCSTNNAFFEFLKSSWAVRNSFSNLFILTVTLFAVGKFPSPACHKLSLDLASSLDNCSDSPNLERRETISL